MIEQDSEPRDSRFNNVPIIWLLLREINCMAGILFMRESPNPLENFIKQLGMSGSEDDLELTGRDIADILWFGLKLQEFGFDSTKQEVIEDNRIDSSDAEQEKPETSSSHNTPVDTSDSVVTPQESRTNKISDLPPPKAPVYSSPTSYSQKDNFGGSSGNLSIKIPDPPSLRDPLDLIKSLRLLMQRVPSGRKGKLDEEATVKRIVDEQIWTPVLEDELEPWLDLALVIDESSSMLIWSHYIEDLKRLFKQYGIFRELTIWGIKLEKTKGEDQKNQEKLQFIARNGSNSRNAQPEELLDATRRRLILIASDCVSDLWRKGIIFPTLQTWTAQQLVAILQMLPRVMWRKSALGLGMLVNFSSSRLGVANKELFPSKMPPFLEEDIRLTQIPILSLEKEPTFEIETENRQRLFKWTEMLLGKRDSLVSGYLLPPELHIEDFPALEEEQKAIDNQDAEQRIARFRRMTSPMGRKLAGLLAAAPVIRLPIVRLIQECMLPQSDRTQIAEVFLGGLLKPKAGFEIDINTDPETVEYEFIDPKIRDIFVSEAPISDSIDVVNAVSRYVAEQMAVSMSNFMAMLKGKEEADNEQQENTIKPFAEVTARVLRRLGGEYAELANELEKVHPDVKLEIGDKEEIESQEITWKLQRSIDRHQKQVNCVVFSPDGKLIASASHDGKIYLSNIEGSLISIFEIALKVIWSTSFSSNGELVAGGDEEGNIRIWKVNTGIILSSWKTEEIVYSVAFHPAQNLIASAGSSRKISIYNHEGSLVSEITAHQNVISSVTFSPDGKLLASCSDDCTIKIWNWQTNTLIQTLAGHQHWVNAIAFNPTGDLIVSASSDKTVRLWSVDEEILLTTFEGHTDEVSSVDFHPRGQIVASGSRDGTIRLWNLQGKSVSEPLKAHIPHVKTVAFSSEGKILASGGSDNTIKIWRKIEGRKLLWQHDNTRIFSLYTNEPWKIPFEGLVISTGIYADFKGSLASSFMRYYSLSQYDTNKLIQARDRALNELTHKKISPESPLIFALPPSIENTSYPSNNSQKRFIICTTVQTVIDVRIAVKAIVRLITELKLKTIVLPILGTGNKRLFPSAVAHNMLSTIHKVLNKMPSNSIEEITFINKSESSTTTLIQTAETIFGKIKIRNTARSAKPYDDGRPRWNWTVYIDTDKQILSKILRVEYTLHETFTPPVRSINNSKNNFALKSGGWGEFLIKIKIFFRDGSTKNLSHWLELF